MGPAPAWRPPSSRRLPRCSPSAASPPCASSSPTWRPAARARLPGSRRRRPSGSLASTAPRLPQRGRARPLVIGGKSMGGRVASLVADEACAAGQIVGLVCLGYPFHPPNQPAKLRTAHLEGLACPTLIVQGERDPFGPRAEVEAMIDPGASPRPSAITGPATATTTSAPAAAPASPARATSPPPPMRWRRSRRGWYDRLSGGPYGSGSTPARGPPGFLVGFAETSACHRSLLSWCHTLYRSATPDHGCSGYFAPVNFLMLILRSLNTVMSPGSRPGQSALCHFAVCVVKVGGDQPPRGPSCIAASVLMV